jgi:hypothetical protein
MSNEDKKEKQELDYFDIFPGRGHTRVQVSIGKMLVNNFLGGLAWGFGTVLGATVVVALVLFILSKLDTIPLIGDFINNILEEIQQGPGR